VKFNEHNHQPEMDKAGYIYALAVAAGGVMGYVRKGSAVSLAAGVLFGSLAAAGTFQMSNDPHNCYLLLASSVTLAVIMGLRSFKSGKFMPAGLVASLRYATIFHKKNVSNYIFCQFCSGMISLFESLVSVLSLCLQRCNGAWSHSKAAALTFCTVL
jgi:uncharacterized membrane protein (UPF0136 family)